MMAAAPAITATLTIAMCSPCPDALATVRVTTLVTTESAETNPTAIPDRLMGLILRVPERGGKKANPFIPWGYPAAITGAVG